MKLFDGKRITVAGVGAHGGGVGNIRWLADQGAELLVTDLKPAAELKESLEQLQDLPRVQWVLGEHREQDFQQTDMVVRNPAMPRNSSYLQAARAAKVPIEMDSSLFFKHTPSRNIIGVTGSKGKTTTTLAIAHLMKLVHAHVVTVGVEGTSPLAALPTLSKWDVIAFELSSWRIEALREHHLSPHTAVITSLYRDHLNTYDSFEEYIATKKALIAQQQREDRVLLNYDDELVRQWGATSIGAVKWYSMGDTIPGDGVCVKRGVVTVILNNKSANLFSVENLPFPSDHQRRNLLPAIYLAFCNKVRVDTLRQHLSTLEKPAHRLEFVKEVRAVRYVNDSASTIPEATIAALDAHRTQHLVLIAGGSDKKLKFASLARRLPQTHVRAIVLLPGNATPQLLREIRGAYKAPPPLIEAPTMEEAVEQATKQAKPGDVVLLSPGATSFGLFNHEFDRGNQFRKTVELL